MYAHAIGARRYVFDDLRTLLARASPLRSGDELAGLAAATQEERVAARRALADVPLAAFLESPAVPYDVDEVTRLVLDTHDAAAFAPVRSHTVGQFRDWLLSYEADAAALAALAPGLTPEMAAAVSKLMRNQDLILVAGKCRVVAKFRTTLGLPGRVAIRLQPNHPTDDPRGIAASILDGLLYGAGDAVVGINPASDSVRRVVELLALVDDLRTRHDVPAQSCVLAHVTTTLEAIRLGAPVDLVFQSIGGTEATNRSFGVSVALLREAHDAARALARGTVGENLMYFETGQGSALSADAHHGVDQQTCEARAYGLARHFRPLLVNTVVGFIGPEYLYDGKQIVRAGLEDHFCGKLLGVPMGCDVCYTNHSQADQDDMDTLMTLLGVAGCNFFMGVPGADDVMLNYQSTSFHDAQYLRQSLGLRPAPEFEAWLQAMGVVDGAGRLARVDARHPLLGGAPAGFPDSTAGSGRQHVPTVREIASVASRPANSPSSSSTPDPWHALRRHTPARIALGRAGASLPTAPMLDFQLAHAQARDAVHLPYDVGAIAQALDRLGLAHLRAHSAAPARESYLRRPDLGRRLDDASRTALAAAHGPYDAAFVVADGLSALAAHRHAVPLLALAHEALAARGWRLAPVVIAQQSRVALGDEIGEALGAGLVAVLIGERPGLSSPDSLGVYLTFEPRRGRSDAQRNCISNVRPQGLPIARAAHTLVHLMLEARVRGLTGVQLKDDSDAVPLLVRPDDGGVLDA